MSRKDFTLSDHTDRVSTVSRRTLMRTAAGAGVAAGAIGIVGAAGASSPEHAAGSSPDASTAAGPIVVHVTDVRRGTLEVFAGDSRSQVHDVDLAARIARAAG
jgi:hypothetical protein